MLLEFVSKRRDSYGYGAIANFSAQVTEGQRSVIRAEEERGEQESWIMNI